MNAAFFNCPVHNFRLYLGYANDLRFQSFTFFPALNDNGQVAFEATMTGGDGERIHAVWMGGVDSLALVARNGDRAPGTPEGVHFAGFDDPKLNSVGQIAFRGYYSGSETTDIVGSGVWAGSNEALRLVASSDMHIPGTPEGITPGGFNLGNFNRLTMNSAGRVAFFAILSGGGDDSGIWSEGFGSLALVALAGDHAPGTPPEVEFADFGYGRAVLNAAGQTAFYTTLRGPGLTQSSASGIWAQDRKGNLHLVVRGGDQLEVAPGDIRTVAGAGFMAGSGNDDGSPSGFNDRGQLAFVAYFTDGSQGVFVSDVVAIPEPASLLLSGFIAAMAVRRGRLSGLRPGAYFCELER